MITFLRAAAAMALTTPIILSLPAYAQTAPNRIPAVSIPVTIDGSISPSDWDTAIGTGPWERFGGPTPVQEATEIRLLSDRQYLYVLVKATDKLASRIRANETQRGSSAVLDDDSVRIHIDSQGAGVGFSTFAFNTLGTQYTELEGGTSSNWKWAGDWKVAVNRYDTGYTAEVAIPWKLLRHPKGASSIGFVAMRRVFRESNPVASPPLPANLQTTKNLAQFMGRFETGLLPDTPSAPVILPYSYATAGATNRAKLGVDIKAPVTTGVTALATLFPDFQNIENDVNSVAFSYNEQALLDRRPFFAEGNEFMPERDLFYSRRITAVDSGAKLVGRDGNQTFGALVTSTADGPQDRTSTAFRYDKAFSPLKTIGAAVVSDNLSGAADSRVVRISGDWGEMSGRGRYSVTSRLLQSWNQGSAAGVAGDLSANWRDVPGRINAKIGVSQLDSDFYSPLGVLVDKDRRGSLINVFQSNRFDTGVIEAYTVDYSKTGAQRQSTGEFFYDRDLLVADVQNRRGFGINMGFIVQRRIQQLGGDRNVDRVTHIAGLWNRRTLFSTGGVGYDSGRQNGQSYHLVEFQQGFLLSRLWNAKLTALRQSLGDVITRQVIVTTTLRIDSERSISARLVGQNGTGNVANIAGQPGTNLYMAYSQRTRSGTDYFLIVGDPNKPNTRGQVTLKMAKAL
jgi:hypothetical protein